MITLVIEDGSGVTDANSYIDITYADTIATLNDEDNWLDCNVDDKNKAIVKATQLVDTLYGPRYKGSILNSSQSLLYPRGSFMSTTGRLINAGTIPKELKNAIAYAAFGFFNGDLTMIEDNFEDANIKKESFGVGSGAYTESIEYYEKVSEGSVSKSRVVLELRTLLNAPSIQFNVVRG